MPKATAKKTTKKTASTDADTHSSNPNDTASAIPEGTRFEDALDELETIVNALETGEQSLEESLTQFERGISLARYCQKSLGNAEQKISVLMNPDADASNAELQAFSATDSTERSLD